MKKRGSRKAAKVAELLDTPSPLASPPQRNESPDLAIFNKSSSAAKNNTKTRGFRWMPTDFVGDSSHKSLTSISDLKDFASSRLDELKRHIDHSHSEILKDLDASKSRLQKRLKIQTQACQQVIDEAEKDYKRVSERVTESGEAMKVSYHEFIADAHDSASRACGTAIAELSQSFQTSIDSISNRYACPRHSHHSFNLFTD